MFRNRLDAGLQLARRFDADVPSPDAVVVGLPRGGVPVAAQVARHLGLELDVIVVRKLGVPFRPELAMGAIGECGVRVLDDAIIRRAGVTIDEIRNVEVRERAELDRRAQRYRADARWVDLSGREVIIVDDGVATGSTARAACQVVRAYAASRVILAVPVAPAGWTATMAGVADEFVAVMTPKRFGAVGAWYSDFAATTDSEVVACLAGARS